MRRRDCVEALVKTAPPPETRSNKAARAVRRRDGEPICQHRSEPVGRRERLNEYDARVEGAMWIKSQWKRPTLRRRLRRASCS
jgi:hypothetical protein